MSNQKHAIAHTEYKKTGQKKSIELIDALTDRKKACFAGRIP